MNYEEAWKKLQQNLLETIEQIDTSTENGLFTVAGIGNAITYMVYLEGEVSE